MSVSYYSYCGPYIRCVKKYEIKKIEFNGCTNIKCLKYHAQANSNFCSKCGNPIGKLFHTVNVQVNRQLHDLIGEDILQVVTTFDKYDILLSNKSPKNIDKIRQYCINFKESNYQDLTDLNVHIEMDELAKFYAKEIDKLKILYGEDQVKICWGILTWSDC